MNNFSDSNDKIDSTEKKDWAEMVDEDEKKQQLTLDEYKEQIQAKKRAQQEKIPKLNRRVAGEGVDPKDWSHFARKYHKNNEDEDNNLSGNEEGVSSDHEGRIIA